MDARGVFLFPADDAVDGIPTSVHIDGDENTDGGRLSDDDRGLSAELMVGDDALSEEGAMVPQGRAEDDGVIPGLFLGLPPPSFPECALRRMAEFQRFFTAFSERPGRNFAMSHQRLPGGK